MNNKIFDRRRWNWKSCIYCKSKKIKEIDSWDDCYGDYKDTFINFECYSCKKEFTVGDI